MNFTLYPIYSLAGAPHAFSDNEQFDLDKLPFEIVEDVRIEDISGLFPKDTFDLFTERLGKDRLEDLKGVHFALVHRYPDPLGYPQEQQSDEKVQMCAACLRLIRPMRQTVLSMRGRIQNGMFDVSHFELPAANLVEVPEVQKLFQLRNRDADDLRAYAPEFLRGMRGEFWKFRMAVQFHQLGHFQALDWKARFLLWCSAIESIYTSRHWEHKGSLVAASRIRWFLGEGTSIYAPGDISSLLSDPRITVGSIVRDLYTLRNYVAHGDRIPDQFFTETQRAGFNGGISKIEVILEAASFIIRASLLKILREHLVDHFADAGPAEAYFGARGLTLTALRESKKVNVSPAAKSAACDTKELT